MCVCVCVCGLPFLGPVMIILNILIYMCVCICIEGNGDPLQYPCLENSMDRGAWQVTDHGVAKIWTRLSN